MHYKNGREAKPGDKIVGLDHAGNPIAGFLVKIQAGTTCNGYVAQSTPIYMVTLGDCLHADDALAVATAENTPTAP